jgi:hypothetical protein
MRASQVGQKRWSKKTTLFENDKYSVIVGDYYGENSSRRALGERWRGKDDDALGFPSVAGYPIWHVVPEFLEVPILRGLLDELARNPQPPEPGERERPALILQELARLQPTTRP